MGSFRLRLTLASVGLVVASTTVVLGLSFWLMGEHLSQTTSAPVADAVLDRLAGQYVLAVIGAGLFAVAAGWALAGRLLAPVRAISETTRRVGDSLDERVALPEGARPGDELFELATSFDAMLDRVQAAVDAQRRFVANASHELRTPLTVIRTEAEVALDDPHATAEELRAVARAVLETTDRTEELLESLLVLAAAGDGRHRAEPVALDAVVRRAARDAGAPPFMGMDLQPSRVSGDAVLLERLAGNLVENALRHGTEPRVELFATGDRVILRVTSGGPVIDPVLVPRLAEPFERGNRRRGEGAGLGLSIVRAIAEAHGGELHLTAPAAGGLRAEVSLPIGLREVRRAGCERGFAANGFTGGARAHGAAEEQAGLAAVSAAVRVQPGDLCRMTRAERE